MKKVMSSFLKRHYSSVVETKDYIYAEGTIPIALVAHMDTVFKKQPEQIYFDQVHNVMWSPQGLGADDRAGIFAIVQIVRSGLRPHVILTTDEERGAFGAMALARIKCPFKELKYLIQLDRRGSDDCVFYECDNHEFIDYVEGFGFSLNYGSFTDISEICPAWMKAGVNLSVGYYNEHSETEILFVGQLLATISKVIKMLEAVDTAPEFKYIPSPAKAFAKQWYVAYGMPGDSQVMRCNGCNKYFMEEELLPTVMEDKTTGFYCPDCIGQKVSWCPSCGNAFENLGTEETLCIMCREKVDNGN